MVLRFVKVREQQSHFPRQILLSEEQIFVNNISAYFVSLYTMLAWSRGSAFVFFQCDHMVFSDYYSEIILFYKRTPWSSLKYCLLLEKADRGYVFCFFFFYLSLTIQTEYFQAVKHSQINGYGYSSLLFNDMRESFFFLIFSFYFLKTTFKPSIYDNI